MSSVVSHQHDLADGKVEAVAPHVLPPAETPWQRVRRKFFASRLAATGFWLFVFLAVVALLAPWIAPQDPYDLSTVTILNAELPPMARLNTGQLALLGTDGAGRDVVSAILYGLRISIGVGMASALVALLIGTAVGQYLLESRYSKPFEISRPSEGLVCGRPMPRKLIVASSVMAWPVCNVTVTRMGAMQFGRMWRNMIRDDGRPWPSAASTYSFCRSTRALPRTDQRLPGRRARGAGGFHQPHRGSPANGAQPQAARLRPI